jgi:hypothetical protein
LLLRYLAARLRHWDPAVVRYLKMGLGIEQRAHTLAPFWAEHLKRTRAAQERWAKSAKGEWLTVLGAGHLLDFDKMSLLPRFQKLRMVDADRLCQPVWNTLPKPVEAVCLDISQCLDQWIGALGRVRETWTETLRLIREHRAPAAYGVSGEALLSLNILSQLQIVWQDGVEALLERRFGLLFVRAHEDEWLDALRPAGQTLVEQHLAAIERTGPGFVLLITDLEYLEYKGVVFETDRWAPPPVDWSAEKGWSAESGVTSEVSPALEGVELNEATFARWLPSYRMTWQECWLWHIAPLGTETVAYGEVHRVGAFALERSC